MSLKEARVPHYKGKVGLKRRLPGHSRLLLGKLTSRYKRKDGCTTDETPHSPKGRSKTVTLNYNCYVQEETTEEPPGSTQDSLTSFKESTRVGGSSESWCHSLKQKASDSKHSKMQESFRLNGWRKFFCHVLLCPRYLKFKTSIGDQDQSQDFTFCNRQTRGSFDMAVRPSVIYQVIEHKEGQQIRAVETERRPGSKTEQSFLKRFFCLQDKPSSTKPNHKGLDPAFVVQEDTSCPCLNLRIQLNRGVRQGGKKPSPFFQERIGIGQEYIQEETIVLSNRQTDEGVHSARHSICDDDVPRTETLEVSVDVMPVTSQCELKPSTLDASHTETCSKPNSHLGQNDSEYARLSLEEKMSIGIRETDNPESSPDIGSCQEEEDEGEADVKENLVNAPENLMKRASSVAAEVTQEDQAMLEEHKSTVDEDGRRALYSIPENNSDSVSTFRYESGQSPEEMDIVDEIVSCPDAFIGKNGLDSKEPQLGDDVSLCDLCVTLTDLQPPEIILYQTARLLVQATIEAALRQLEKDLIN
ncbi:hypothetical protein ACEWY4_005158 [Coilia grayii]|uniref:Uncharacterized protein n=1 Tax=Coilia grayii TaxID=363190 RepID=A0ABD1KHW7_9TELE